jgi:ABC-type transport system involved in multi-copper enzyme maturation permease subunit
MATTAVPVSSTRTALPAARGRAGFGGALRSELTKIRSVRSTYWSLIALVVITIGIGALFAFGRVHDFSQNLGQMPPDALAAERARDIAQATAQSLFGLILGQLVIAVLGALTITSEYSTGMIRTSLSVMPRRGVSLAAKAVVFGAIALVVGLVTSFISYFVGQAILSTQHINSSIGQPGVLRAVIGGGLFLAVCGLLSFGLGAIIRHTAGAITASIGVLFVLFILSGFLPNSWAVHVDKWVPFNAGGAIWENQSGTAMFSPWTGFAVFCAYAAIALGAGLILFRKRDA